MQSKWEQIFSVQPLCEKTMLGAGVWFSCIDIQDGNYVGRIEDGYVASNLSGHGRITQQTDYDLHFGQLLTNSIILTPPTQKVEWQITGHARLINIFLSQSYIRQVASSLGFPLQNTLIFRPMFQHKDKLVEGIFSALQEQIQLKHFRDYQYLEAIVRTLCIHLLYINFKNNAAPPNYQRTLHYEQMEMLRDFIMENLERRIHSSELAYKAHISHYHFYRLFKRTCGMTPQQFIKKCRLEKAKLLVENTSLSLGEVSYKTGFTDQSHLSREYRALYGISPGKRRDQILCEKNFAFEFYPEKSSLILILSNLIQDIPLELFDYLPIQLLV